MAIKSSGANASKSLHFRILAPIIPIIVLMVILGGAVFSVGLKTVSDNANVLITEDLERTSKEIYNISDSALQTVMMDGYADVESVVKVRQGNTLGKIEDYARQQRLQIVIYDATGKSVLTHSNIPLEKISYSIGKQTDLPIQKILHDKNAYYAYQFEFELWNWQIILIKDGKTYANFINSVSNSYFVICGILLIATVILIIYFRRVVHHPVRSIINSIQSNGLPSYRGIYEFEFLSNVIREAAEREQKKQAEMSYQASHDPLTGLANRREFERRLGELLHDGLQTSAHTILYLDLDQFKLINDTCGHHAGDALLQQLSKVMKECLRQSDVLARLGGDEFGVLLVNCSDESALKIAESILKAVSVFRFAWNGKVFSVGVSIGLVAFSSDHEGLTDLLSDVDGACYIAKEKGRNRIHVHRPHDSQLLLRKRQMNWVARITAALENNRLVLFKQKIAPLQTNDSQPHFELLLRMIDEDGRLVLPDAFIPAAERYNLMPAIDFWVIKNAFAYCRKLSKSDQAVYTCSINLSGATIGNERLISYIRDQFREHGIPPKSICFEITETVAISDLNNAAALIRELRELGCRIALDDFGSGMSSFGYLKRLPVDFIKIDGSFVKNMLHDRIDRAMVSAINHIGHVMGIKTVAEFVEDEPTREKLKAIKVDFAQGNFVGKPEPLIPIGKKMHHGELARLSS